jgi:hypothetical protein
MLRAEAMRLGAIAMALVAACHGPAVRPAEPPSSAWRLAQKSIAGLAGDARLVEGPWLVFERCDGRVQVSAPWILHVAAVRSLCEAGERVRARVRLSQDAPGERYRVRVEVEAGEVMFETPAEFVLGRGQEAETAFTSRVPGEVRLRWGAWPVEGGAHEMDRGPGPDPGSRR